MAEPIVSRFGKQTRMGSRNLILDGTEIRRYGPSKTVLKCRKIIQLVSNDLKMHAVE